MQLQPFHKIACLFFGVTFFSIAHAGLFEDDEARKAILDLRQRVEFIRAEVDQVRKSVADENVPVTKALLELQRQIEILRSEVAGMRGCKRASQQGLSGSEKERQRSVSGSLRSNQQARTGQSEPGRC
jgi:hypothetical protein